MPGPHSLSRITLIALLTLSALSLGPASHEARADALAPPEDAAATSTAASVALDESSLHYDLWEAEDKAGDREALEAGLRAAGYLPVDRAPDAKAPEGEALSIYASYELDRFAIVTTRARVAPESLVGRVIEHDQGLLFHGSLPSRAPFALFITDASDEQMREALDAIGARFDPSLPMRAAPTEGASRAAPLRWLVSLLSPGAALAREASEADCPADPMQVEPNEKQNRTFARLGQSIERWESKMPGWGRCPWGVARGIWESTFGDLYRLGRNAKRLAKSAINLVTDPIGFWRRTAVGVKNIGKMLKYFNFREIFRYAFRGLKARDPGIKTQTICQIVTEVAIGFGSALIPVTGATSLAQKALLLYEQSSTYRKVIGASAGLQESTKIGVHLERKAQEKSARFDDDAGSGPGNGPGGARDGRDNARGPSRSTASADREPSADAGPGVAAKPKTRRVWIWQREFWKRRN